MSVKDDCEALERRLTALSSPIQERQGVLKVRGRKHWLIDLVRKLRLVKRFH